jgi:hypothetical protein
MPQACAAPDVVSDVSVLVLLACCPHMRLSCPQAFPYLSLSFSVLVSLSLWLSLFADDDPRLALPNGSRSFCLLFLAALALSVS